jgi:molybdenum cofactor cytidylyltransferase
MMCAVVLAAGRSQRMGTQKLVLPVGGQPMVARIVDQLLAGPIDRVFAVVGADADRIRAALAGRPVTFVVNADQQGEMLSSVRCGLAALPPECTAALIVLGDQPGLTADVAARLWQAFQTADRGIVVPTAHGRRGHPLLVALRYHDEILARYEAVGLRGLLQAHPEDVHEVEVGTPRVLEDVDTPQDFERLAGRRWFR